MPLSCRSQRKLAQSPMIGTVTGLEWRHPKRRPATEEYEPFHWGHTSLPLVPILLRLLVLTPLKVFPQLLSNFSRSSPLQHLGGPVHSGEEAELWLEQLGLGCWRQLVQREGRAGSELRRRGWLGQWLGRGGHGHDFDQHDSPPARRGAASQWLQLGQQQCSQGDRSEWSVCQLVSENHNRQCCSHGEAGGGEKVNEKRFHEALLDWNEIWNDQVCVFLFHWFVCCVLLIRPEMAGVLRPQETGELRRAGSPWMGTKVRHECLINTSCLSPLDHFYLSQNLHSDCFCNHTRAQVFSWRDRYLTLCLYTELLVSILNQVSARPSCPRRNGRRGGKSWRPSGQSAKLRKVLWN